ncbi:MAG: condensation domain-containing protein [Verrucomicrobiales bacterium]|nr:condensation domain-containing protein [Verrucomicrobiales bacterium]
MEKGNALSRLKELLASGKARLQPLTFSQREIWETSPVKPSDPANHICSYFEIKGPATVEQMKLAVARVVERQEAMRTSFLPGKERPLQIIRASGGEPAVSFRELTEQEGQPGAIEGVMAEGFFEPFDFLNGPLYRMCILQRGPEDWVVAFTIHHAVGDGWTLGAFVGDLCTAYILGLREAGRQFGDMKGVRDALEPLVMTHSQWGAAERAQWKPVEIAKHVDFWKDRLSGSELLWGDASFDGDKSERLQRWVSEMNEDQASAIRELARQNGVTTFNVLLAAFQWTLFKWTGKDDVVLGTPVANRTKASVRETMGYFSGVVPLRGHIDSRQAFADRVKQVHEETMDAFEHAIPFAELAETLGEPKSPQQHSVFDTRFAYQNHPMPEISLPGVSTKVRVISTGTARFDLACELTEDNGGFEVVWLYRSSVVSLEDVHGLNKLFQEVLTSVCSHPEITAAAAMNV